MTARQPLVFRNDYRSPCEGDYPEPGRCDRCGRKLVLAPAGSPKRYCGPGCCRAIKRLPPAERQASRAATPLGVCVRCGSPVEVKPPVYRCPRVPNAYLKRWRRSAGGQLRFGPDGFEWLAAKLGCDPTDPRLPDVALRLAKAGQLTALVGREGQVIGLAKPKASPVGDAATSPTTADDGNGGK